MTPKQDEIEALARALKDAFAGSYIAIHDEDFLIAAGRFLAAGYGRTDEAMERAAKVADTGHLVPPDGGSPSEAEHAVAKHIAAAIRAGKP